ncbi:MAG: peptidoglycan-binding protein [Lachnospiraceae bacterium]|nr:peptidoglycan-binding protein [Lachnospiraceae bacterium]
MGLTGQGLADYAISKKGTPYFFGSKMNKLTESYMAQMHKSYPAMVTQKYMEKARNKGHVGKINVDCSGLISAYTGKILGSSQLYAQAYTRLPIDTYKSWANGVVCWRSGHVGVFYEENGKYYVAEAKGIDYGTMISNLNPNKWKCGLTFSWIDYSYAKNVVAAATWKGVNPYNMPSTTVCRGDKGEGVKWLQWELVESGYDIVIDGIFGAKTEAAVKRFQLSCKITVDGKVGNVTRGKLAESC